jgi:hypothetical protein
MAEEVRMLEEEKVAAMTLEETVRAIEYHNKKYWVDSEPEISDESYDLLVRHLTFLAPEHPLLAQVHAPVVAGSGKVIHTDPMLSLDKAYSLQTLLDWAAKFARTPDELLLAEPKYDGISASFDGSVLATRGDGEWGEDITGKLPLIELEAPGYTGSVDRRARGEIVIRQDDFINIYGNIRKKDIGEFIKRSITSHFKSQGVKCSVKYFDPSYTIRSVPARGTDAIRCYMLARNAVHAAMAGRTDCVVGNLGESYALVPIKLATIERQTISLKSDLWRSVMDATGQEYYFKGKSACSGVRHSTDLMAP